MAVRINFTFQPPYLRERNPVPFEQKMGWGRYTVGIICISERFLYALTAHNAIRLGLLLMQYMTGFIQILYV